jgi:osmotically-inducible protein OsmY
LNPNVKVSGIEIKVDDGAVTLFGTVDAYWKKLYVEDLVSKQPGVRAVRNELAVVPTGVYLDQDVAKAVAEALRRSAFVNAHDINVEVKDGVVVLTGVVSDELARRNVRETAAYTDGVICVQDQLRVPPR